MKVVPAVENWNMSSATSIRDMFYGCAQIETLDLSKWDVTDVKDMRHTFADCFGLKSINFSGWNTPNLENLDGTFNDCLVLTDLDMSNFNTSKVSTMAQLFEGCASLTTVKGMEKWDTTSLWDASEMFNTNSRGSSLEVVDLSSFNTKNVENAYYPMQNGSTGHGFLNMLTGMTGLEKLIIGEGVVFNGNGSVSDTNRMKLPAPAAKAGFTAKWRNVETGELFDASQIPEKVAATYEAHYIANT
jgi:surface protein